MTVQYGINKRIRGRIVHRNGRLTTDDESKIKTIIRKRHRGWNITGWCVLEINMIAKIISSPHPDVPNGTKGKVLRSMENGWVVQVTTHFEDPNDKKRTEQTRELWFETKCLKFLGHTTEPTTP